MNNNIKCKLTIPFPLNNNSIIYSKEAVERAYSNIINTPIIYKSKDEDSKEIVIGHVVSNTTDLTYGEQNQIYNAVIDVVFYANKTYCEISAEVEENVVTEFSINSIGIIT